MDLTPVNFYNWLKDAEIYNKRFEKISPHWIAENADTVVLLFTAKGIDKNGIIESFYSIYENVKYLNLPVEVIYIPMDDSEEDFLASYEEQANWFTFKFNDPLVHILKYMYDITCIPHIYVIRPDCSVVSTHGLLDLEMYKKNAIITWLSPTSSAKGARKLSRDAEMYGNTWKYLNVEANTKSEYHRKFSVHEEKS